MPLSGSEGVRQIGAILHAKAVSATAARARQGETMNEIIVGYFRVLLSAPPMTVLVVFVLVRVFKTELKTLMDRIATIKFLGSEISTTSQVIDHTEKTGPDELPTGSTETALPEGLTLSPDQQKLVTDFIQAQKTTSRIWEYRYFNSYFVHDTQLVLDWLVRNSPSIELFHAMWMPKIPKVTDRESILLALQNHNLITVLLTMIEITEKGRDYLQWRGPLPYFPNPKTS